MVQASLLDVASEDGWKRYLWTDVLRALGYCRRVLSLREKITVDSSNPIIKKMVLGVIGKDTIGHWKDIQTVFKEFFGVVCINCRNTIRRIALGIPFEKVVDEVSLKVLDRGLVDDVKPLASALGAVISVAGVIEDIGEVDAIETTLKRLASNPLEVLRIVKGFYSTTISLLPLYNRYTFFSLMTRSIHERLLNTFFPNLELAKLSKYGLRFNEVRLCRDSEYRLYIPSTNSIADPLNLYVKLAYKFIKKSLGLKLSTFFGLVDEEKRFVLTMVKEARTIEQELAPMLTRRVLTAVQRHAIKRKVWQTHAYSVVNVIFCRDSDTALIGSARLRCEDLLDGLSPYIITGLAYFDDIRETGEKIGAELHMYYQMVDKLNGPSS